MVIDVHDLHGRPVTFAKHAAHGALTQASYVWSAAAARPANHALARRARSASNLHGAAGDRRPRPTGRKRAKPLAVSRSAGNVESTARARRARAASSSGSPNRPSWRRREDEHRRVRVRPASSPSLTAPSVTAAGPAPSALESGNRASILLARRAAAAAPVRRTFAQQRQGSCGGLFSTDDQLQICPSGGARAAPG